MGDLKRYMVFGGQQYYPGGGTNDLIGTFFMLGEAEDCVNSRSPADDWWEIYDVIEGCVIAYG